MKQKLQWDSERWWFFKKR